MKIAFVTPEFIAYDRIAGGVANYIYKTSYALVQEGHEVHVFVISRYSNSVKHDGITIHEVAGDKPSRKDRLRRMTLWGNSFRSKVLREALLNEHWKHPFDIVQYTSSRAVGLYRIKSIPSVIRLSSYRPLWKSYGARNKNIRSTFINDMLELKAIKKADAVYSPSNVVANYVQKHTGIKVEVVEPIYIDDVGPQKELSEKIIERDKDFILFTTGVLSYRKGADVVADMIFDLLERYPHLHLVIAGPDTSHTGTSMGDYIVSSAKNHGDRVLYIGKVNHSILYGLYQRAAAVLQPSRMDNLPNSCIEAMANGAVVVGTRGASFEQLITHGKNGFLANAGDPPDLLEKTEKALSISEEETQVMGQEAQKRIDLMRPPESVEKLVEYYTSVINKKAL